jgi:hypothetical protein
MDLPAKESATLVPGQQIRVRFEEAQTSVRAKLLVPTSAIVKRGELTAVYVATAPGTFALRAVRLGQAHGSDSVEVVAGVSAGEAIALDPIRAGSASTSRTKN